MGSGFLFTSRALPWSEVAKRYYKLNFYRLDTNIKSKLKFISVVNTVFALIKSLFIIIEMIISVINITYCYKILNNYLMISPININLMSGDNCGIKIQHL